VNSTSEIPWCAGREIVTRLMIWGGLKVKTSSTWLPVHTKAVVGRPSSNRLISVVEDPMLATPVLAESGVTAALLVSGGVARPAL